LVEAWAKVRPEGWRMKVVGPDEQHHSAEVKALVQQAGIADAWGFTGEISDREKLAVYEQADLFILPSYSENFGMAVAEALSAGLPVITTKGCPWEGLQRHDCGRWVAPTVDGLAAGLRELCAASDDELLAMGQRGRRWMESDFSWNKIAERMAGLYEAVLQRSKA
jgi:glycosyltransferase involved in cell wall biosynthesis